MSSAQVITQQIEQFPENELIFARKLFQKHLCSQVSESAFYKTLERLCKSGSLCRIAKGTYYRPKIGKYGIIPPSQKNIVSAFTAQNTGTIVGYALYNQLKLTTQVSKTVEVFSSAIEQQTKSIRNVLLQFHNLNYTPEIKAAVSMLEVLQNFDQIQDLNYQEFCNYCKSFSEEFNSNALEQVLGQIRYSKRTISFLRNILNYHSVPNKLGNHLSSLSEYKHPTMEDLYEAAHIS